MATRQREMHTEEIGDFHTRITLLENTSVTMSARITEIGAAVSRIEKGMGSIGKMDFKTITVVFTSILAVVIPMVTGCCAAIGLFVYLQLSPIMTTLQTHNAEIKSIADDLKGHENSDGHPGHAALIASIQDGIARNHQEITRNQSESFTDREQLKTLIETQITALDKRLQQEMQDKIEIAVETLRAGDRIKP